MQHAKRPSYTKSGPGRYHKQGKPGSAKEKARGFKGATFSIPFKMVM